MEYTERLKEDIYRDYHAKVFGYIYSKINNRQNAEDLASDVFMKVFDKLDSFDDTKSSLSTWIFVIARNTLTDYYRTRRVFNEIPETMSSNESVEDAICSAETLEALANALETLDERERDIIVLRYYSGHTLKDIAAQLGISYAYVKILQNKALEKLRKFIGNQ